MSCIGEYVNNIHIVKGFNLNDCKFIDVRFNDWTINDIQNGTMFKSYMRWKGMRIFGFLKILSFSVNK